MCSGSCLILERVLVTRKLDLDALITSLLKLNQWDIDDRQVLSFLAASSRVSPKQEIVVPSAYMSMLASVIADERSFT